MNTLEHA